MHMKKLLLTVVALALFIPSMVFGATVNVNLKTSQGADFTDLSAVTVRLLDGVGTIVQETIAPASAQISFPDLDYQESYTVVVKYHKSQSVDQNGDVAIDSALTKSVRFSDAAETFNKDFFIANPVASNVSLKASRIPTTWTAINFKLVPAESSKFQVDKTQFVFNAPVVNGNAELTVPVMPSGRYTWTVTNQDESASVAGTAEKTVRTDGTFSVNLEAVKPIVITFNFSLKNIDKSAATFAGENIHIDVKDATAATVYTKDITASGATITDSTPELVAGIYDATITMANGTNAEARETIRQVQIQTTMKTVNVNFVKLDRNDITFLVRDSRNSQSLTDGSIKIKDSKGTLIEEAPLTGSAITKSLVNGYAYNLETAATGYSSRTQTLIPRGNATREINLFKQ
jgi:hypothetical protein